MKFWIQHLINREFYFYKLQHPEFLPWKAGL